MTEEIKRNYLEIKSLQELNEVDQPLDDFKLSLVDPIKLNNNFQ